MSSSMGVLNAVLRAQRRRDDDAVGRDAERPGEQDELRELNGRRHEDGDAAKGLDVAVGLQRAQVQEVLRGRRDALLRRRVDQLAQQPLGRAEVVQEDLALEVDGLQRHAQDLRRRVGLQALVVAPREEVEDHALLQPPAAAAPLAARGLRAPRVAEALHGPFLVEDHLAHDAEVQDVADVGDGDGGLRDVCREDDLAAAARRRRERPALLLVRHEGVLSSICKYDLSLVVVVLSLLVVVVVVLVLVRHDGMQHVEVERAAAPVRGLEGLFRQYCDPDFSHFFVS